jgi:hypothetical protein
MKAIMMAAAMMLSLSMVACGSAEGTCKSACKKAADCKEDDAGYQDKADCEKGCEALAEAADKADCNKELKKAVKCGKKNFECDGSGFEECESEFEDYGKCLADGED